MWGKRLLTLKYGRQLWVFLKVGWLNLSVHWVFNKPSKPYETHTVVSWYYLGLKCRVCTATNKCDGADDKEETCPTDKDHCYNTTVVASSGKTYFNRQCLALTDDSKAKGHTSNGCLNTTNSNTGSKSTQCFCKFDNCNHPVQLFFNTIEQKWQQGTRTGMARWVVWGGVVPR